MNESECVAIVAHDAGGAEILSSYVRQRVKAVAPRHFVFALDGPARKIFERKLGIVSSLPLDAAVAQADSVLCGTGWQSDLEVLSIILARQQHKKSTAFLDHWVNYRERFLRYGLLHWPDEIWVGDAMALELVRTSVPEVPAIQVDNPYFTDIQAEFAARPLLPVSDRGLSILYVCEPVRQHALLKYGNERHWGYTEEDALRYFLDHLDVFGQTIADIVLRPHPAEPRDKYSNILFDYDFPLQLSDGRSLVEEIASSHWVVGCNSMAMVIGLLGGRQVLCCIPPGGRECQLPQPDIWQLQGMVKNSI